MQRRWASSATPSSSPHRSKWPDNGWLALAAAATQAQNGNFLAAAPLYEKAYKSVPSAREYLAIDAARVRRINLGTDASLRDLAQNSQQLRTFAAIESGEDVAGTPLEAYNAIARGQVQRAVALAKKAEKGSEDILWLAAASEGASTEMIETALGVTVPENADVASMFAMYGLAAREGRDTTPYAKSIEAALGADSAPVLEFLAQVRRGADALQAREAIRATDLRTQLFAQNAVVLMRGTQRATRLARTGGTRPVHRGARVSRPAGERTGASPARAARAQLKGLEVGAHHQLTGRIGEHLSSDRQPRRRTPATP